MPDFLNSIREAIGDAWFDYGFSPLLKIGFVMFLFALPIITYMVLAERKILAMGGHEDGIVVFGGTMEEAGQVLLTWLARAYESTCAANGLGLCKV